MKKPRSEADVRWMYYAKALSFLLAWSLVSGLPCYHGTAVILLNHGAANKDAAFKRIFCLPVNLPRNGCKQVVG